MRSRLPIQSEWGYADIPRLFNECLLRSLVSGGNLFSKPKAIWRARIAAPRAAKQNVAIPGKAATVLPRATVSFEASAIQTE